MSNKPKIELKRISDPATISFLSYLGDYGGCGYIRVILPLMLLNNFRFKGYNFTSNYLTTFVKDSDFYKGFSFVMFQRSATEEQLNMIRYFQGKIGPESKTPVIYEIDDLLFDIPEWNFASDYYKKNEPYIKQILSLVHGISVSTEPLKKIYSKYNKNVVVQPNRLIKALWGEIKPAHLEERKGKLKILWTGSSNHFCTSQLKSKGVKLGGDFGNKLLNFIKKTADVYNWIFVGAMPLELMDMKDKIEYHGWKTIIEYPNFIKSLKADIGIAPLDNNFFNDCKSNLKMLEYTAIGCPGIYSNSDPYKDAELACSDEDTMISRIEELSSDVNRRAEVFTSDFNMLEKQMWFEDNLVSYINNYLRLFKLYIS